MIAAPLAGAGTFIHHSTICRSVKQPMGKEKECQEKASIIAEKLREKGHSAVIPSLSKSIGGAFKMADRLKASKVLLVNSDLTL